MSSLPTVTPISPTLAKAFHEVYDEKYDGGRRASINGSVYQEAAMADGDDIEAGRTTGANQTTIIVGESKTKTGEDDFRDDVFLVVTRNASGRFDPLHATDGVFGVGFHSGFGMVGFGGGQQGTGVVGQGGWFRIEKAVAPLSWAEIGGRDKIQDRTSGGIGLHGLGGNQEGQSVPAGSGVVGQGGKPDTSPTNERISAGPGVVGVAGGLPAPDPKVTRDSGVYGEGPTGVMAQGAPIPGGSAQSIGLVARGAHGVEATGDRIGLFAQGNLFGGEFQSKQGFGIISAGFATGGLFASISGNGQVVLFPGTPRAEPPADGIAGALLFIGPAPDVAAKLWLCTVGSGPGGSPAIWNEVQLGPPITGRG